MPAAVPQSVHMNSAPHFGKNPDIIGPFTIAPGRLIATIYPDMLDELRPSEPLTPTEEKIFIRASFGDTITMAADETQLDEEVVRAARDGIVAKYGVRNKLAPAISRAFLAGDLPVDAPAAPSLSGLGRNNLTLIADILHGTNLRRTGKHLGISANTVESRRNALYAMLRISGENALPRAVYEKVGLVAIRHPGPDS